jgi:hypothetical protein
LPETSAFKKLKEEFVVDMNKEIKSVQFVEPTKKDFYEEYRINLYNASDGTRPDFIQAELTSDRALKIKMLDGAITYVNIDLPIENWETALVVVQNGKIIIYET